ncbi:hypothetical protein MGS_04150 [Candida albicans P78042]|nr:hypothetical protein MEK_04142 [Candida albicans 12C]KGU27764.1 hypothetical protein MGK_04129 [Candida albicans P57055]KHC74053.1 hypothetical protein MGS_04150 [Candida albicans P78042]RLP65316.1 hypothetical protein L150_04087 [Candida albicans Ca529L]
MIQIVVTTPPPPKHTDSSSINKNQKYILGCCKPTCIYMGFSSVILVHYSSVVWVYFCNPIKSCSPTKINEIRISQRMGERKRRKRRKEEKNLFYQFSLLSRSILFNNFYHP